MVLTPRGRIVDIRNIDMFDNLIIDKSMVKSLHGGSYFTA